MNEEETLISIFSKKWKDKYFVKWCYLCDCAYISCKKCTGSTCNGHSCYECENDFLEFESYKISVESYLTKKEITIYNKCLIIKKLILETIPMEDKEINFKKLNESGELSNFEVNLLKKELIMEIEVKKINVARDGGTTVYVDKDGKQYWKDKRIGSLTKDDIYDRYPSDPGAQILNVKLKYEI